MAQGQCERGKWHLALFIHNFNQKRPQEGSLGGKKKSRRPWVTMEEDTSRSVGEDSTRKQALRDPTCMRSPKVQSEGRTQGRTTALTQPGRCLAGSDLSCQLPHTQRAGFSLRREWGLEIVRGGEAGAAQPPDLLCSQEPPDLCWQRKQFSYKGVLARHVRQRKTALPCGLATRTPAFHAQPWGPLAVCIVLA